MGRGPCRTSGAGPGWRAGAGNRRATATGRWPTRSATWSRAVSPGGRCPRTSPRGTASTPSSDAGATRVGRPSSTTGCGTGSVKWPTETRNRPRASSTPSRSKAPPRCRPRPGASTAARRSTTASATSWWTPSACCWPSPSRRRPPPTRTRDRLCWPGCASGTGNITRIWADGGYTGQLVDFARNVLRIALTVVKRSDDTTGFVVLQLPLPLLRAPWPRRTPLLPRLLVPMGYREPR